MTTDRERALRDARIWLGAHEARAGNDRAMIEASRIIRDLTALAQPVAAVVMSSDWLWGKLMDWCKRRNVAPTDYDDLFQIVCDLRAAQPDEARELGAMDMIENLVLALELQGHADMSIVTNARSMLASEAEKKRS